MTPEIEAPIAIVVMGDVMVDYQYDIATFPISGQDAAILSARATLGGSAANAALGLSHLGVPTAFATRVGTDSLGRKVLEALQSTSLNLETVQFGQQTGYTITFIEASSERTMFSFRGCGADPFGLTPALESELRRARLLLLSGYSLLRQEQAASILRAATLFKQSGSQVALDPSPMVNHIDPSLRAVMLGLTDILLPNRSEAEALVGPGSVEAQLHRLTELAPCAVIKQGSQGASALTRPGWSSASSESQSAPSILHAPALPVKSVDTTGAGDAFNAGFLAALARGENLSQCLQAGNALAAQVVVVRGGSTLYLPGLDFGIL